MREALVSRLLMAFVVTGLFFMLLPGTFLGVWNLISISSARAANAIPAGWIQAHGHAQIFGWLGSFILGIGFYSIPKLRGSHRFAIAGGWICWGLWTTGVMMRWLTSAYSYDWRVLLPLSALLELSAFLIFFRSVSGHRPEGKENPAFESWVIVVIGGTLGLLVTLTLNLGVSINLALHASSPAFPPGIDQRFLSLTLWGFLVPFVWGFSARWLPVFLGLEPLDSRQFLFGFAINFLGVLAALLNDMRLASLIFLLGAGICVDALRLLKRGPGRPRVAGVHDSFAVFVRLAYVWLLLAALLEIWAAWNAQSNGLWGAARHALTVGFLATMVFSVGPRILPSFSGMRILFSPRLMLFSLCLLTVGCATRVAAEILAYQEILHAAWSWLPVSAILELSGVIVFALNMGLTFATSPAHQRT